MFCVMRVCNYLDKAAVLLHHERRNCAVESKNKDFHGTNDLIYLYLHLFLLFLPGITCQRHVVTESRIQQLPCPESAVTKQS